MFSASNEKSFIVELNNLSNSKTLVENRSYELDLFVNIYCYLPIDQLQNGGTLIRNSVSEIVRVFTNWNSKKDISNVDVKTINFESSQMGSILAQGNKTGFVVSFIVKITNQDTF
jgi:hypothetical protein